MQIKNYSRWAQEHGFSKQLVCAVIKGQKGKLESPHTKSFQIKQALIAEGLWKVGE